MWYTTKKGILEHLGKNGRDVKQLDRLIKKGVVIENKGSYAYRYDREISVIRKLKGQIKEKAESNPDFLKIKGELDEALANVEYYKGLCKEEIEDKERIIERCFRWIQKIKPKADWEQFREWVTSDED